MQSVELLKASNFLGLKDLASPDFISHGIGGAEDSDLATAIESLGQFHAAYPDWTTDIEHAVAEGDMVALPGRWRGTDPASGRSFNIRTISFERVVEGKITESWLLLDETAMHKQLTS